MAIIRTVKRENPFVQLDKRFLDNPNLSWRAKGMMAYLLSKPANWQIQVSDLVKKSPDGRDSVYSILREIRAEGYLLKMPVKNDKGKITHWIEELYEEPSEEVKAVFEKMDSKRKARKEQKKKEKEADGEDNQSTSGEDGNGEGLGIPVDESVDKPVDEMLESPLTESTEMAESEENPLLTYPEMAESNMGESLMAVPEILIISDSTNIDFNNIDSSNREKREEKKTISLSDSGLLSKFYDGIKKDMTEVSFNTWIKPLTVEIQGEKIVFKALNEFTKNVVATKYLDLIKKHIDPICSEVLG